MELCLLNVKLVYTDINQFSLASHLFDERDMRE